MSEQDLAALLRLLKDAGVQVAAIPTGHGPLHVSFAPGTSLGDDEPVLEDSGVDPADRLRDFLRTQYGA